MKTYEILIVDDSKSIRLFLKAVLSQIEANITEASNGIDAYKLIQNHQYDLIFMDINMPGVSGLDVIKRVRKKLGDKYTPIIVMTDASREDVLKKAFDIGATDFISKPLHEIEVLARMKSRIEHYELDLQLYEARKAADKANEEKSGFIANVSHELRTPMHAILSFTNLAIKKTEDAKVLRYLENTRTSGIRLIHLLNDLLDLSKLEAGKMDVHFVEQDLTSLVSQALSEVDSLLQKKFITVNFNLEQQFVCMIDHKMMMQVMVNLLSNAIKFSPEYSVIDINIKQTTLLFNEINQDVIHLTIVDRGVGIPPDEVETVFDKFIQSTKTKSGAGGTGLGLPITKEIMEIHKGCIWVESPPSGEKNGTAFHIQIPKLHGLSKFEDMPDIEQVIDAHLKWKTRVDNKLNGNVAAGMAYSDAELNHHLCTLGKWIDSKNLDDADFLRLKSIHEEFHLLAAELIGYSDMDNYNIHSDSYSKFKELSVEIVKLLKDMNPR